MTNSHGYVLEYPRIRVDHFDQASIPLPPSLLAHRRSVNAHATASAAGTSKDAESLSFAPGQTHFDKPLLYLLTHIHTDHLKGLDRPGITAPIYCSTATKNLLLKYERQKTRIERDRDGTNAKQVGVVRPYAHLRVTDNHATARSKLSGFQSTSLDLLQPLPYNVPTKVQYTPTSTVTLTLIESNHMFGGTMFLIQGVNGAVLHTGDLRAEAWWCEALTRNPFLSPYLCWSQSGDDAVASNNAEADNWADHIESFGSAASTSSSLQGDESLSQSQGESSQPRMNGHTDADSSTRKAPRRSPLRLRNIYLDTELLLCNQSVPTKQQASLDLVTLLRLYPPDTVFFLNAWTWGYEDMLIVTAKAFGCKIHVDRFKYNMYKAARSEAPFLADIVTLDGPKTRFHACEKRNVCEAVQCLASRYAGSSGEQQGWKKQALYAHSQIDSCSDDARQRWGPVRAQPSPLLVYVNPGQIAADRWPSMFRDTKQRLEAAARNETAWPEALVVPIERHSTLPELQMFVGLFRPRTVSPNTILDPKGGLDYYLLHHLFGHLLAGAEDRQKLADEGLLMLGDKTWSFYEKQLALARAQAQVKRGREIDSTEAIRATSASFNAMNDSVGESLDAFQLERLSKLRGISFKGLMMQNMAGNLAAMLEIERWRRAAGIDEAPADFDLVMEESLGSMSGKTEDASVASVDYDADQSQVGETQALSLRGDKRRNRRSGMQSNEDSAAAHEMVELRATHDASAQLPSRVDDARRCASPPALQEDAAIHDTQSQADVEEDEEEPSTVLTEDLASRYLNVLIHYFHVSFIRSSHASHISMWKSVRKQMPDEAQKVEEHWFRETGVLPPLWSSQPQPQDQHEADEVQAEQLVKVREVEDDKRGVFGEILASFVDMLAPHSSSTVGMKEEEEVAISTEEDTAVALQLILRHLAKVGFQSRVLAESSYDTQARGHSHASCIDGGGGGNKSEWQSLADPLSDLAKHLTRHLDLTLAHLEDAHQDRQSIENATLTLQLTSILLSYRPLNSVIQTEAVRALFEKVVCIVESAPTDTSALAPGTRKVIALACAVLRAEELEESVLAPFEERLLELIQDPDGPLRRMESLGHTETAESGEGASQSAPREHSEEPHATTTNFAMVEEESLKERESFDVEASSLQIRPPRIAAPAPAPARAVTKAATIASSSPAQPQHSESVDEDSLLSSQAALASVQNAAEDDTIESVAPTMPVAMEASQASSATQEEDSTQSEQGFSQEVGSLPSPDAELRARGTRMGRTGSLPSMGRGERGKVQNLGVREWGKRKAGDAVAEEERSRRSRR